MNGVNKVILIGTLGRDPETKYTQGGSAVTSWSMATNETWNDKQTGEKQQKTEWHNCVAFGRLAEVVGEYGRKGEPMYVEGKLTTRSWDDQESGKKMYRTEVQVFQMQLLGRKEDGGSAPPRQNQNQAPPPAQQNLSDDDFDDDIPF